MTAICSPGFDIEAPVASTEIAKQLPSSPGKELFAIRALSLEQAPQTREAAAMRSLCQFR